MRTTKENDFEFIKLPKITKTGSYTIASIKKYHGKESKVTIPHQIQGAIVEVIQEKAFMGNTFITEVHIPDTVESIANYAFSNCPNLEKVTMYRAGNSFSNSECIIGCGTFYQNPKLKSVLSVIPFHLYDNRAFSDCPNLESVTKILELPHGTFQNCKNLKKIVLGKTLRVDKSAIKGCNIQTILIEGDIDGSELEKLLNRNSTEFMLEIYESSEFMNLAFEGIRINSLPSQAYTNSPDNPFSSQTL